MANIPDGVEDLGALTVAARRALLDALDALEQHRNAVVVVGAQAVYLRSEDADVAVASFTSDADLGINPALLADEPHLEQLMLAAGFALRKEPGLWFRTQDLAGVPAPIEVDLLVPTSLVPKSRRSAQMPPHDKTAARTVPGLELALHDNDVLVVPGLGADTRRTSVSVAGVAALLVAKAHKLHDRLDTKRLNAKDAADVYRLVSAADTYDVADRFQGFLDNPDTAEATRTGLALLTELFQAPRSPGVELAVEALREGGVDEDTVRGFLPALIELLPAP